MGFEGYAYLVDYILRENDIMTYGGSIDHQGRMIFQRPIDPIAAIDFKRTFQFPMVYEFNEGDGKSFFQANRHLTQRDVRNFLNQFQYHGDYIFSGLWTVTKVEVIFYFAPITNKFYDDTIFRSASIAITAQDHNLTDKIINSLIPKRYFECVARKRAVWRCGKKHYTLSSAIDHSLKLRNNMRNTIYRDEYAPVPHFITHNLSHVDPEMKQLYEANAKYIMEAHEKVKTLNPGMVSVLDGKIS